MNYFLSNPQYVLYWALPTRWKNSRLWSKGTCRVFINSRALVHTPGDEAGIFFFFAIGRMNREDLVPVDNPEMLKLIKSWLHSKFYARPVSQPELPDRPFSHLSIFRSPVSSRVATRGGSRGLQASQTAVWGAMPRMRH